MGVVKESGKKRSMSSSKWLLYVVMVCWYTGKYLGGTWPKRKSACQWKSTLESGLVRWSAISIEVFIPSRWMRSGSTHSHRAKYFILIWWLLAVGFWVLPIAVQPLLSSYVMVAASCGISRYHKMLWRNSDMQPTSHAAMNSTLVEERAKVGWNYFLWAIVPPVVCTGPVRDRSSPCCVV